MKTKLIALIAVLGFAAASFAQEPLPTVNVSAKGDDVRSVLHDLFGQAKKNYMIDPGVRYVLYLSLNGVEFEEALILVCKTAKLKYEIQNGIYFVSKVPASTTPAKIEAKKPEAKPIVPAQPKGKLPETVLTKPVTTHFERIDIRTLFNHLSKQTGVTIEIDKAVPAYKLDAILEKASLKFALQTICAAAKLKYAFTENQTILLSPKKDGEDSRVSLRND